MSDPIPTPDTASAPHEAADPPASLHDAFGFTQNLAYAMAHSLEKSSGSFNR